MPTVPQTVVTESVRARAITSPLQSGRGVDASGLARGLDVAAQAEEASQLQQSQIRMSDAETEILNRWSERLNNADDAFFKLKGQDAVESLQSRTEELKSIQDEVFGRLKTGTEKRILSDALAVKSRQIRQKMNAHSFNSQQQWDKSSALANRVAQYESAAIDPSQENLELVKHRIIDNTEAISKIDGISDAAAQLANEVAVSTMFRTAVESLIESNPFEAGALLDKNRDEILSGDEAVLDKALKKITLDIKSGQVMTDAINANPDNPADQLTAIDRATGGKNPGPEQRAIRESARQKAVIRANQIANAEGLQRQSNLDNLAGIIASGAKARRDSAVLGQEPVNTVSVVEGIRAQSPESFEFLTATDIAKLQEIEATAGEFSTNPAVLQQLKTELALDPNALGSRTFAEIRPHLNDDDFEEMSDSILDARAGKFRAKSQRTRSLRTQMIAKADEAGIDKDDEEFTQLDEAVQLKLDIFGLDNTQPPTPTDITKMIDDSLQEVVFGRERLPFSAIFSRSGSAGQAFFDQFGSNKKLHAFQVKREDVPNDEAKIIIRNLTNVLGRLPRSQEIVDSFINRTLGQEATLENVPAEIVPQLRNQLRDAQGREPTNAEIVNFYLFTLQKQGS